MPNSPFSQGPSAVSPKANGTGDTSTWADLAPLALVEWKIQCCIPRKQLGQPEGAAGRCWQPGDLLLAP